MAQRQYLTGGDLHASEKATALRDRINTAETEIGRINCAVRTLLGERYHVYLRHRARDGYGEDVASGGRGKDASAASSSVNADVQDNVVRGSAHELGHNDFDQNGDGDSNGIGGHETQSQTNCDNPATKKRNPLDEEEPFDALVHVCRDDAERRALGFKVRICGVYTYACVQYVYIYIYIYIYKHTYMHIRT